MKCFEKHWRLQRAREEEGKDCICATTWCWASVSKEALHRSLVFTLLSVYQTIWSWSYYFLPCDPQHLAGMEPSAQVISSHLGCTCLDPSLKLAIHQRKQYSSWHSCFTLRRILVKNLAKSPAILICVLKILFSISVHMLSCYLKRSCDFPSTGFPVMRSFPTVQCNITCESERNFFNSLQLFLFPVALLAAKN